MQLHSVALVLALQGATAWSPGLSVRRAAVAPRLSRPIMVEELSVAELKAQLELAELKAKLAQLEGAPAPAVEVPAPIAEVVTEVSPAAPAFEAPIAAIVPEAAPAFEAPIAAIVPEAAPSMAPAIVEPVREFVQQSSFVNEIPAAATTLNTADTVPWGIFLVAFTVFPAAVLLISEVFLKEKPEIEAGAGPVGGPASGRTAGEIFEGGIDNLGKAPMGWLFGEPSPLYSNEPPPAPAAPPAPPAPAPAAVIEEETVGVVEPTAVVEPAAEGEVAETQA